MCDISITYMGGRRAELTRGMLKVPTGLDPNEDIHLHIAHIDPRIRPTPSAFLHSMKLSPHT
jgi:hypothetical protein